MFFIRSTRASNGSDALQATKDCWLIFVNGNYCDTTGWKWIGRLVLRIDQHESSETIWWENLGLRQNQGEEETQKQF